MSSMRCVHPIYPPNVLLRVVEYIHMVGRNSKVVNNDDDDDVDDEEEKVL